LQPNAFDFMKTRGITVQGTPYHDSRTLIMMNEKPLYLSYTQASFGFVGRSVYQRALFPLKAAVASSSMDIIISSFRCSAMSAPY
jgi:hypothetical protein